MSRHEISNQFHAASQTISGREGAMLTRSRFAVMLNWPPAFLRESSFGYELQSSMQEVFQFLEDSRNDPDQFIDFDDAIQTEHVFGGKVGDKKRPFHFTYYDGAKADGRVWELQLHLTEIEDIGDCVMTDIPLFCCENDECGYKTRAEAETCLFCKTAK